jgi:hypothetical protein
LVVLDPEPVELELPVVPAPDPLVGLVAAEPVPELEPLVPLLVELPSFERVEVVPAVVPEPVPELEPLGLAMLPLPPVLGVVVVVVDPV